MSLEGSPSAALGNNFTTKEVCLVSRAICFVLTLAMVGCAQQLTPFGPTGSQSAMPNARAIAVKPAGSVVAHVVFRNQVFTKYNDPAELTVYWSYAANPFWHVEIRRCVKPGDELRADVVYNHIKEGPQIKFGAQIGDGVDGKCGLYGVKHRAVLFRTMNFEPDAHFQVEYKVSNFKPFIYSLCAHGGGNKEVCDKG